MPRPASLRCWPTPTRARPRDYPWHSCQVACLISHLPGGLPHLPPSRWLASSPTFQVACLISHLPGGLPHLPPSRWLASSPTFHRDYPWHSCREVTNSNNLVQVSITRLTSPPSFM